MREEKRLIEVEGKKPKRQKTRNKECNLFHKHVEGRAVERHLEHEGKGEKQSKNSLVAG